MKALSMKIHQQQTNMNIHLISGFLGSGKTTAIQTACKVLQSENKSVGVITNDQGIMLVDTGYFESNAIPNRQVINGCFCCNYNALDENIQSLIQDNDTEIFFAESVGSCTDIVATVMKPLLQFKKEIAVTVSTFADARLLHMLFVENKQLFNDEVRYIYQKQLEEAQIIVVSKIDLITEETHAAVQQFLQAEYPGKQIIFINGTDAASLIQWLNVIQKTNAQNHLSSLNIDYDIYGAGEAMLAWLDEELVIYSSANDAQKIAVELTQNMYRQIQLKNIPIGHLKFLIDKSIKISYATSTEEPVNVETNNASSASVLINARVQTTPLVLSALINKAIQETENENSCSTVQKSFASFQPGYPRPTHRITDTIIA
jgi:G3E family GTPase